jgi:tripartite-type tricarboxylate transporter receptor subunit TctC
MFRRALLGGLAAAPLARPALAQGAFGGRPVRLVVAFPAGGGTDILARMLQDPLAAALGATVIVENRGGGSGMIAAEHVARSAPDGTTLLMNITTHVQAPVVLRRFPYDPIRDFSFIARIGTGPITFMVGPAVPPAVTSFAEFVAWGRGRPLSFGNFGSGSTSHAFGALLAREARLDATQVAYRGEAPMLQDNIGGQFHGGFHSTSVTADMIRAGRIRPLASGGPVRTPSLADRVPTLVELGLSRRFAFVGFTGVFAPAGLPPALHEQLAGAFRQVLTDPAMDQRLRALDVITGWIDPPEFRTFTEQIMRQWQEMAEDLDLYQTAG